MKLSTGLEVEIPSGFETDLASVPRPLWGIFPPYGRFTEAAIVHDYLCRIDVPLGTLTRKQADLELRFLARAEGVGWWTGFVLYRAVRFGAHLGVGVYKRIPPVVVVTPEVTVTVISTPEAATNPVVTQTVPSPVQLAVAEIETAPETKPPDAVKPTGEVTEAGQPVFSKEPVEGFHD